MEQTLAALGNRVFLMNNVHDDGPTVFQSRWALSFLRGPLSRQDIQKLMNERKQLEAAAATSTASAAGAAAASATAASPVVKAAANSGRPILAAGCYRAIRRSDTNSGQQGRFDLSPNAAGQCQLSLRQGSR